MSVPPFGSIVLESPLEDAWRAIEGMIIKYIRKDPPDNDEWIWIERLIEEHDPEMLGPDLRKLANHSGNPGVVTLERLHWILDNYDGKRNLVNNGSWVGKKFIPNENATEPIISATNLDGQSVLDPEVYATLLKERDDGYKRIYKNTSQAHYTNNDSKWDILNHADPEVRRLFLDKRRELALDMIKSLEYSTKELADVMGTPIADAAKTYKALEDFQKNHHLADAIRQLDESEASEDFVRRFASRGKKLVLGHATDCPSHQGVKNLYPEGIFDLKDEEDPGPRSAPSPSHLPNECTCGYMPRRGGHYGKSTPEYRQWTAKLPDKSKPIFDDCEMCDGEGKIEGLEGDCPDCAGSGEGEPTGEYEHPSTTGPAGLDMGRSPIHDLDEDRVRVARRMIHKMNQMTVYETFFENDAVEECMLTLQGIRHHHDECVDEDGNITEPHEDCNPKRDEKGAIIIPTEHHTCPHNMDMRLWDTPWFTQLVAVEDRKAKIEGKTRPGTDYTNLDDRLLNRGVRTKIQNLVVILDEFQGQGVGKNAIMQKRHDRIINWWKSLTAKERKFILGSLYVQPGHGANLYFDSILDNFDVGSEERQSVYRAMSNFEGNMSLMGGNILGNWGAQELYKWLNSESESSDINTEGEMEGTLGIPSGDSVPPFPVMMLDADGGTLITRLKDRVERSQVIPKECDRCDGRGYGTKKTPKGKVVPDRTNPCTHCDTSGYIEKPLDEDDPEYMTQGQMNNAVAEHNSLFNAFKDANEEYTTKRNEDNRQAFTSLTKDPSLDFNELARQNNIPPKVLQWVVSQYSFIENLDKEGRMKELHAGIFNHGGTIKTKEEILKSDPAQKILRDKMGMFEGQFRGGKDPGLIPCAFPEGCGGSGRVPRTRGGNQDDDWDCLRCDGKGEVSAIRFTEASKEQEDEIVESILREYRQMQKTMTVRFIQISADAGYTQPCNACFESGKIENKTCKDCNGAKVVGDPERLFNMMMEEMMKGNTPQVSISNIIKRFSRFLTASRGKQFTQTKAHLTARFVSRGLLEDKTHILLYDPKLHIKGAPLNIDSLLGIREQVIEGEAGGKKEGKFFTIRKKIARMLHNRLAHLDRKSDLPFLYSDIIGGGDEDGVPHFGDLEEDRATNQDREMYISNLLDLLASDPTDAVPSGFLREKIQHHLIPIMHPDIFSGLPSSDVCYQCAGTTMDRDNNDNFIPYSICPRCKVEEQDEHGRVSVRSTGYLSNHSDSGHISSPLDSSLLRGWNPGCAQCEQGMHSRVTQRGGYGAHSREHASSFDTNVIPMLSLLFELNQSRENFIRYWNDSERKDPRPFQKALEVSEEIKHLREGEKGFITKELGRDFNNAMTRGVSRQTVLDNVKTLHEILLEVDSNTGKTKKKQSQISMTRIRCPYCEDYIGDDNKPPVPENWGSGAYGEGKRDFSEDIINSWNVRCGQIAGHAQECNICAGMGRVGSGVEETDCTPCGGTGSVGADKEGHTLKPYLCTICQSEKIVGGCGEFDCPMLGDKDGIHGSANPFMPATGCPNDDGISISGKVGRTGKEMLADIVKRKEYKEKGALTLMDEHDVQWPVIQELQKTFPGIAKLTPGELDKIKEEEGSIPDALKLKLGNKIRKHDYSPIPPFCTGDYVVHSHERGKRIGSKKREDYPMQDFAALWLATEHSPESGQGGDLQEHWSRGKEMLDKIPALLPEFFGDEDTPSGFSNSDSFHQQELERLYAIHILFPMHLSTFHRRPTRGRDFMGKLESGSEEEQKKARKVLGLPTTPVEHNEDISDEQQVMFEKELEAHFHKIAPLLMLEKQWEIALVNRKHMLSKGWPKSLFNLGDGENFITGLKPDCGEGVDKIVGELRGLYSDAAYLIKYGSHSPDQHGFLPKSIRFPSMFLFRGNSHMSGPIAKLWKKRDLSLSNPESEVFQATDGKYATRKVDPEGKDGFVPMTMEEMRPLANMIWRFGMGCPSGFQNSKLFTSHEEYKLFDQYPSEFPYNKEVWMQQLWFRIRDELLRAAHNPEGSARAFAAVIKQRGRTHPAHLNGAGDGTVCGVCDSTGEMFALELLRHLAFQTDQFRIDPDSGEQVKTHLLYGRDGDPLERNNSMEYPINKRALEVLLDNTKPFIYGEWENVPGFDPDNLDTIVKHRLECPGCNGTHICSGCDGDGHHRVSPWTKGVLNAGLEMLGGFGREMNGEKMNIPYQYRGQLLEDIIPPSLRVDEDSALWRDMDEEMLAVCGYNTQQVLDEEEPRSFLGGYTPPFGTVFIDSPSGKKMEVTAPWNSKSGMGTLFNKVETPLIDLYENPPWGEQSDTWEALSARGKQAIRDKWGWPKEWRDGKVTEEEWNQIEESMNKKYEADQSGEEEEKKSKKYGITDDETSTSLTSTEVNPVYCQWGPDHCGELCLPGHKFCGPYELEMDGETLRATGFVAPNHQSSMDGNYMGGFDSGGTPLAHFHGGHRGIQRMIAAGFRYVGRKGYGWAPWFERELKEPLDEEDEKRRAELEREWGGQEHGAYSMNKYQRYWEYNQIKNQYRDEFLQKREKVRDEFKEHLEEIYKQHTRKKNPIRQKKYEAEKMKIWDSRVKSLKEAQEDIYGRWKEDLVTFFHSLDMEHMWVPYFTHPHSGNIIYSPFDFDGSDELPPEPKHHNRMLHNLNMANEQHKGIAKYKIGKKYMSAGLVGIGRYAVCPNCQNRLPGDLGTEGSDNTCPLANGGCGMVFDGDSIPSKDWTSRHGLESIAKPVEERKILRERLMKMIHPEDYPEEGGLPGVDPALVICTTCRDTGEIRDPTGKRGVVACPNCIYLPGIDPHLPASGHAVYGNEDTGSPTGGHYVTLSNWDDALLQYHRPNYTLVKGNPEMKDEGGYRHISDGDFADVLEALGHGAGGKKANALLTATAEERKLLMTNPNLYDKFDKRYLVKDGDKAKAAEHLLMALLDGKPGVRFGRKFEGMSLIPTLTSALFSMSNWAHPKYKEARFNGVRSIPNKVNEINKYLLMAGGGEDYARLLELSGVKSLRKLGNRGEDVWDAANQRNIPGWKRSKTWKKKLKECQSVIQRLKNMPNLAHHDKAALADAEELQGLLNPPNLASMFDGISKSNVYWLTPDGWDTDGVERDIQETLNQGVFKDKEDAEAWLNEYVNSRTHGAFFGNDSHAFGVAGMEYVNEMERLLIEKDERDSDEIAHLTPALMYATGKDTHLSGGDGDPHLQTLRRLFSEEGPMLDTPNDYEHDHIGDTGYWGRVSTTALDQGVPTPTTSQPNFPAGRPKSGPLPAGPLSTWARPYRDRLEDVETVEGDNESFDVNRSQDPIDHAWDSILKNLKITQ